ncbi:MAG: 3-isopropylmalate dehydratase small subunit [Hyphomicrobiaceae bacterium]|nr:3-isopropylmalate dehydratase small subunit [Hyphomicrobiaceae bacterium]
MTPLTRLDGIACPLPLANVDTDQLIPARFMSRPRAAGYGEVLLHGHRFDADGKARAEFPLNQARYAGASILVALRNFGSGSSREAAVYALVDFGFRCVIAPSFGDIFAANAVNNGLLPAVVPEADAARIIASVEADARVQVDLESQAITAGGAQFGFAIDPVWRTKLLNGWDDLDLTRSFEADIRDFFARDAAARPWMPPRRP